MPAGDGEKIDQRIEVPQPVLDRRGRQHQNEAEAPVFQRLSKAFGHLRRLVDAVQVPKLVRFVEDQHLVSVFGNLFQIKASRIVGGDDRSRLVRLRRDKSLSDDNFRRDVELLAELRLPLRPK